jgi:isoleucyl-tRNA synthetase/bisphosphoglycerate-dependent phosphoglycerate mutase
VISSRSELEKLTSQKVDDLHKHFVDDLSWKCTCGKGKMERIPEVLDCWFESGAMPYASVHYPFASSNSSSNLEFQSADFIAEGLDQTRGWFYTLHVLGCALFGKNIYKNVITNGIILAEDGQKMSKSKKNYPDPNLVFDKYGADAMRFYLLSSPVVRGENFRFSEHGVSEVLKQIILPLRSSYQFFSTYANIDGWKPTKFIVVRHGQGQHNVLKIYSGKVENDHSLTEKGQADVKATAKTLGHCDVMYSSPFVRTQETVAILKKGMKFAGEIQIDERIQESGFGDLEGTPVGSPICRFQHTKNGVEPQKAIIDRFKNFIEEKAVAHQGETVVVVTHGDGFRAITSYLDAVPKTSEDWRMIPMPHPSESQAFFPKPKPKNELDKWILSEFQDLLQGYREKMDAYQIDGALQNIVPFIDQLNNWYLRRSRTRFWASGMNEDKQSAYETLHYVLMTFSKILAPICPFFAEKLYQDLMGGKSVHLEFFPYAQEEFVDKNLNTKINLAREIVALSAGIRARQKIKLRQPLQKLQFFCKNAKNVDIDVLMAEANVKEIEILDEKALKKIAQKIVRVDAKKVGPRLGKKVQEVIKAGKDGLFKENSDGSIEIEKELLQPGEFEVGFLTQAGLEADSSPRAVVILDTELTPELELEGMMREVIRTVQDLRKTSGFDVSDRIEILYSTDSEVLKSVFATHLQRISKEVLAETITQKSNKGAEMEIDGEKVVLELKRK